MTEIVPPAPPRRPEGLRIMIVEDEFFIALDIEAQVAALGHVVIATAVSADQAVALAETGKPDVVLMDVRLSGARDGIDAAVEIRRRFGIESIIVTANTDPRTLQRAHAIAPLGVIEKPLRAERLRAVLEQLG